MQTAQYKTKCPYGMNPTRLVIHNTANDASAEAEIKYMQSNSNQTSFHFAVDDKEAVQGVELWRNAWHAGDGLNGIGNRQGIAIEICYSKSGGARFDKAEENAAELAARLLIDFGWDMSHVTKHQDYSKKYCPHRTLDKGWDRFLNMIDRKRRVMAGMDEKDEEQTYFKLNGYQIWRASDFSVAYWDKSKKSGTAKSYINGGFFGYFSEYGQRFTLPVANLVCDIDIENISGPCVKYVQPHIDGKKLRWNTADNASDQFKGKKPSTLVLPHTGRPYVRELAAAPVTARYAVSGIPVIRDGEDVSYNGFVKPQGWDDSCFYATSRNFIGIKDNALWIITGTTKTSNFVATSEVYNALKSLGFVELIATDGGGSVYARVDGKVVQNTILDRNVNNIVSF